MNEHAGHCPCGETALRLFSTLDASAFVPRTDAPTCRFCREHDGVWIADPAGRLLVRAERGTNVARFGSRLVLFHFCAGCSTLTHAIFEDPRSALEVAVARVALFASIGAAARPTVITDFTGETASDAERRRLASWTPLVEP